MTLSDVSILVTCFNKKNHLLSALNTLLELDALGCELIIVDDGSHDGSSEMLIEYFGNKNRVKLILTSNNGSAAARNLALANSKNRYVLFFDIDDQLDINILKIMHHEISSHDYVGVIANYSINSFSNPIQNSLFSNTKKTLEISENRDKLLNMLGYWRILYRKEFILCHSISFRPTFAELQNQRFILDDVFWLLNFFAHDGIVLLLGSNSVLYNYRTDTSPDVKSWNNFVNQASLFPTAAIIAFLHVAPNLSRSQLDWYKRASLSLTLSHLRYLGIGRCFRSLPSLFELTTKFGWKNYGKTIFLSLPIVILRTLRNTVANYKNNLTHRFKSRKVI